MIHYLSIITIIYALFKNQEIEATWKNPFRKSTNSEENQIKIIKENVYLPNGRIAILVPDSLLPLTSHKNYLVANNSFSPRFTRNIESNSVFKAPGHWQITRREKYSKHPSFYLTFVYNYYDAYTELIICQEIRGDRIIMEEECRPQVFTLHQTDKKDSYVFKFYGTMQKSFLAIRDSNLMGKKSTSATEFYIFSLLHDPTFEFMKYFDKESKCKNVMQNLQYFGDSKMNTIIEVLEEMEHCQGRFKNNGMTNFCSFIKKITDKINQERNEKELVTYGWKKHICELPKILKSTINEIDESFSLSRNIMQILEIYLRTDDRICHVILSEFVGRNKINIINN